MNVAMVMPVVMAVTVVMPMMVMEHRLRRRVILSEGGVVAVFVAAAVGTGLGLEG